MAFYEVSATDSMGNIFREIIPGSVYSHTFSELVPTGVYQIDVRAISNSGKAGEAESHLFSLTGTTHDHHKQSVHIRPPTTEEIGHSLIVRFTVEGRQDLAKAFQVEQKSEGENTWHKIGGLIPVDTSRLHYEQKIKRDSISSGVELRVVAIGSEGTTIAHSHTHKLELVCGGLLSIFLSSFTL